MKAETKADGWGLPVTVWRMPGKGWLQTVPQFLCLLSGDLTLPTSKGFPEKNTENPFETGREAEGSARLHLTSCQLTGSFQSISDTVLSQQDLY